MVQGGVSDGVINMDKVMAVRASIEQGAFKVNPEVVADRLLENAQEVIHRGRA
jgi:negative regulator of flagellin synthesis FlgM